MTAATVRTYVVSTAHVSDARPGVPRTMSPFDSVSSELVVKMQGWTRPEERATYFGFVHSFADRWDDHPGYAMMHLIPGVLMLLLMPLQFVRRIRDRHIRLHRWSGRVILVLGAGVAISAFYFGIWNPFVPRVEAFIIVAIDGTFVYSVTRGFLAIRRKDIDAHRRWMIRAYAIVAAIGTVRLVALPLALFYRTAAQASTALMAAFVVGWLLNIAGAEWWLRKSPAAQPILGSDG